MLSRAAARYPANPRIISRQQVLIINVTGGKRQVPWKLWSGVSPLAAISSPHHRHAVPDSGKWADFEMGIRARVSVRLRHRGTAADAAHRLRGPARSAGSGR